MWVWFDDPPAYPDKLLDVTELANYLGGKYGGWYDGPKGYATRDGKFIGLPLADDRQRHLSTATAGSSRPASTNSRRTPTASSKLCKAMQAKGHARRLHAWARRRRRQQLRPLAAVGHRRQDGGRKGNVTINSPETIQAIEYAMELYKTFIPGTESWLDVNNNRAFLAGDIALTANGVSLYYAAKNDPKLAEMAKDIRTVALPDRPGRQERRALPDHDGGDLQIHEVSESGEGISPVHVREAEQMDDWIKASSAYCCQPLKAYADNPIWTADPDLRALCEGLGDAAPQRLCRPARLRLGGGHGGLCARRHVRRSRDRQAVARRRGGAS